MRVDVVIEQRFYCCSEGKLWTPNAFPNTFWHRYLDVFSYVNIVARVAQVEAPLSDWKRVDSDVVGFTPLPYYVGMWGFLCNIIPLVNTLRAKRKERRAVVFRVPGILSLLYAKFALPKNSPFGAEVVGDPADVFAKGASKSFFRPIIKKLFVTMLQDQCRRASATSYVTRNALQQRYPPSSASFTTHYSSIQLLDSDFVSSALKPSKTVKKLICIGNLSQPYKGCDVMLEALSILKAQQHEFDLTWIGGGQLLPSMQSLADKLGVGKRVHFTDNLSDRETIRSYLDDADLFVLSSRQEGLPRVMIEAMARSLACIGTDVGGVNELIGGDMIIPVNDAGALANAIKSFASLNPMARLGISERNLKEAHQFHNNELQKRRNDMYQVVKESCE